MPNTPAKPNVTEDDSFDLDTQKELSPETLARGTRYATEDERTRLLSNLSKLPLPDVEADEPKKP